MEAILQWIEAQGAWGPVLLGLVYIAATICLVPGSLLTLAAGFLFGFTTGLVTVVVASNAAAETAFLVGRWLARNWVERKTAGLPRLQAIDRAVGEQGFKIVLLLRLSPVVPFNLINYALSLSRISFRQFAAATFIGMLPGTVAYVYFGSVARSLADLLTGRTEGGPWQQALFYGGLAATVLVSYVLARIARRALASYVPPGKPLAKVDTEEPAQ
jgi:uncharacterized membrane protein YdjX (TVP38/TMEM64 family)